MKVLLSLLLILGCRCTIAYSQSLDSLEKLMLENNPELKAMQREVNASQAAREATVMNLPNLQVNAGLLVLPTMPGPGMERANVGVSQMLPAKGVLKNNTKAAVAQISVRQEQLAWSNITKLYQLRIAYYQLYWVQSKIETTEKLKQNLSTLQPVALQSYTGGRSPMSQVLRLQSNIISLEKLIHEQIAQAAEAQATIQALLNLAVDSVQAKAPAITQILTNNLIKTDSTHPSVLIWQNRQAAIVYKAKATESMRNPMFGLGLQYMNMANGMSGLMPMVMLEVPIWRKSNLAMVSEQNAMADAMELQGINSQNELLAELTALLAQSRSLYSQLALQSEQLKLEESLREQLQTEFAAGTESLESILEEENAYLNQQLEHLRLRVELLKLQARIDYLTAQ